MLLERESRGGAGKGANPTAGACRFPPPMAQLQPGGEGREYARDADRPGRSSTKPRDAAGTGPPGGAKVGTVRVSRSPLPAPAAAATEIQAETQGSHRPKHGLQPLDRSPADGKWDRIKNRHALLPAPGGGGVAGWVNLQFGQLVVRFARSAGARCCQVPPGPACQSVSHSTSCSGRPESPVLNRGKPSAARRPRGADVSGEILTG